MEKVDNFYIINVLPAGSQTGGQLGKIHTATLLGEHSIILDHIMVGLKGRIYLVKQIYYIGCAQTVYTHFE